MLTNSGVTLIFGRYVEFVISFAVLLEIINSTPFPTGYFPLKLSKINFLAISVLSLGVAFGGDGEKIAYNYDANVVGYGGENDAFSELVGGTMLDCVIVKKGCGEEYQKKGQAKIILDPIVIE